MAWHQFFMQYDGTSFVVLSKIPWYLLDTFLWNVVQRFISRCMNLSDHVTHHLVPPSGPVTTFSTTFSHFTLLTLQLNVSIAKVSKGSMLILAVSWKHCFVSLTDQLAKTRSLVAVCMVDAFCLSFFHEIAAPNSFTGCGGLCIDCSRDPKSSQNKWVLFR